MAEEGIRFKPVVHIARCVIELRTPMSIGTGATDGVYDVALVEDANGLPTVPGTSIAGVLRHLYRISFGADEANALFGFQSKRTHDRAHELDGQASDLQVSFGFVHDGTGRAVQGLISPDDQRLHDPLLAWLRRLRHDPVFRNRVRINHRGAAADEGKFDRSIVPAGCRFAFEIRLWGTDRSEPRWQQTLDLLGHPLFRLGAATRSGLGTVQLVQAHAGCFDLRVAKEAARFRAVPRDINSTNNLAPHTINEVPHGVLSAKLDLRALDFWRVGQGDLPLSEQGDETDADLLPLTEPVIEWEDGKVRNIGDQANSAQPLRSVLVPATAIKGALSHRIAYHYHCRTGTFTESVFADPEGAVGWDKSNDCKAIQDLFGYAKDTGDGEESGQAGKLFFDDLYLEVDKETLQLMMHNVIDRFTGGVRQQLLFAEELIYRSKCPLTFHVLVDEDIDEDARLALVEAIDDLCQGRLAIGAASSRGHGFFNGPCTWDGNKTSLRWLPGIGREAAA